MVERSRIRLLGGILASLALPGCVDPYHHLGLPSRHQHDYYYYPHADVYFHAFSGWYYYRERTVWHRVRRLPPRYRLDQGSRHRLRIPKGNPWRQNNEHRRRYPARPSGRGGAPGRRGGTDSHRPGRPGGTDSRRGREDKRGPKRDGERPPGRGREDKRSPGRGREEERNKGRGPDRNGKRKRNGEEGEAPERGSRRSDGNRQRQRRPRGY